MGRSCVVRLDAAASGTNQEYDGCVIAITWAPEGVDPDVVGQRRRIAGYAGGQTRAVTVLNPFLPVSVAGCRYRLERPGQARYRLAPPGYEAEGLLDVIIGPPKAL